MKQEKNLGFVDGSKLLFKLMKRPTYEDVMDLAILSAKITSLFGVLALLLVIIANII